MARVLPAAETDTSPEDLTVLKAFLVDLLAKQGADATVDAVLLLVARLLRDQAHLTGQLKALLRGRPEGGTEKLGAAQLKLWKDALEAALEEPSGPSDADSAEPPENKKPDEKDTPKGAPKRKGLPERLPRRRVPVPVEGPLRICAICGKEKGCIGHEVSEVLELVPARFEVIVYEREKLACETCPESGVVTAPPVVKPLDGGIPGPGLLADVVIRKSVDHTPINRMLGIYRRLGVDLSANTVYGWWERDPSATP